MELCQLESCRVGISPKEAGEGNRTLVISLEGYCSTIELHPRVHFIAAAIARSHAVHAPSSLSHSKVRTRSSLRSVGDDCSPSTPFAARSRSACRSRTCLASVSSWSRVSRRLPFAFQCSRHRGSPAFEKTERNIGEQRVVRADSRDGVPGSGECRIRTCEGKIHQIYSLTPLTARETPLWLRPVAVLAGEGSARMRRVCA